MAEREAPKRSHSYTRSMRPARFRSNENQTGEELTNPPTTTPTAQDDTRTTTDYEKPQPLESNNAIQDVVTQSSSSDEKESPDPSLIARASFGSQYGRFQIGMTSDDLDPVHRHDHMPPPSFTDDLEVQAEGDTIPDISLDMDEDGYQIVRNHSDSTISTTSSEGIIMDGSGEEEGGIPRWRLPHGSSIDEPIITPEPANRTSFEHQVSDSALLERQQCKDDDAIEKRLSLIKRRQSYKMARRQSMSETDLTKDSSPPMEDKQPERKSSVMRKNAIRRKKSAEDQLTGRKIRAHSVISSGSHSVSFPHVPRLVDTPPALPRRNQPLAMSPRVTFADQSLTPSEFSQEVPPPIPNIPTGTIQTYNSFENHQRPTQKSKKHTTDPQPVAKLPRKLKLHCPRNAEKLRRYLKKRKYDQVERDQFEDTPLHAIIRSRRRDTHELVLVLMAYSDFGTEEINSPARGQDTAMHLAIKNNDIFTVKVLLAFGADINSKNAFGMTPLDVVNSMNAINPGSDKYRQIWMLLLELDAKIGSDVHSLHEPMPRGTADISAIKQKIQNEAKEEVSPLVLANELEKNMNQFLQQYEAISDIDQQIALGLQQFELNGWKTTSSSPLHFQLNKGKRILFLDGGGIRGLIQIEILSILEEKTGEKITNLFDWIVGTSTGGVVALGLVYGKKTLAEIRQFYFKMKDEVFSKTRFGFTGNTNTTQALEDILRETLTSTAKLSDVSEPKVLVAAVNKTTTRPQLCFFNNCLDNELSNEYIWKVARYTSAAPMYFSELDGYIDGGILANNPSDHGLTVIQNYYQRLEQRLDIAAIVSIGAGSFPADELGCTDVHEMLLGMKMLNIQAIQKRARNLMTLLSNALVEGDNAVMNCKSRCEAQRIPFHRFSPNFTQMTVESDETRDELLIEMLIETRRIAFSEWLEEIDELVEIFKQVANERRKKLLISLREKKRSKARHK